MEYKALYRRFRPKMFGQIIGQQHITTILKNQVATEQVSHAYLFCGTRGTGKTSAAKILSRAVNCLSPIDGEPCLKCETCAIEPDNNVDIIEIDAASNNGVDDIRALIEKAVFAPVNLKKKVYIIDEAHMLTQHAFNALLKTLEEPPAHVLFILATTEPRKILPTITSRCQRFDFRRLKPNDITECLADVLNQAGVRIEKDGLSVIARKSNGGMRDALSLADQVISCYGNNISAADVNEALGSVDSDVLIGLSSALISSDTRTALAMMSEISAKHDMNVFLQDLIEHFRALLLASVCGPCADMLECSEEDMRHILEQANKTSQARLTRATGILCETQYKIRSAVQPRPLIELAFVRIARPEEDASTEGLLDRLEQLEARMASGVTVQPEKSTSPAHIEKSEGEGKSEQPHKYEEKKASVAAQERNNNATPPGLKPNRSKINILKPQELYADICEDVAKSQGKLEAYIKTTLSMYTDVEIDDAALIVRFSNKTHYETAQRYRSGLQAALLAREPELALDMRFADKKSTDAIEEQLKQALPGIVIID